jgi:hypothetical protein
MNNPPKKLAPLLPSNPAVDELKAIRKELIELRKDFSKLNQELSMRIAFGVIGSLILTWIVIGLASLIFRYGQ